MQKFIDRVRAAAKAVRVKALRVVQFVLVAAISYVLFPVGLALAVLIGGARGLILALRDEIADVPRVVGHFYGQSNHALAEIVRQFRGVAQ